MGAEIAAMISDDAVAFLLVMLAGFLFVSALYVIAWCLSEVASDADRRADRLEMAIREREKLRRACGRG